MNLDKKDLVNLVSATPITHNAVNELGRLVKFTGNQWGEDWEWDKKELESLTETDLLNLYTKHK